MRNPYRNEKETSFLASFFAMKNKLYFILKTELSNNLQ